MTKAMKNVGMKTSAPDPCMFIGDRVITVAFVDDILFWFTDKNFVNALKMKLREQGLLLEEEEEEDACCLGVIMDRN